MPSGLKNYEPLCGPFQADVFNAFLFLNNGRNIIGEHMLSIPLSEMLIYGKELLGLQHEDDVAEFVRYIRELDTEYLNYYRTK